MIFKNKHFISYVFHMKYFLQNKYNLGEKITIIVRIGAQT